MKVVANMPTAARAGPMKIAAGTASSDHHDSTTLTASDEVEDERVDPPRISDQTTSPTAMSRGANGVASMAS